MSTQSYSSRNINGGMNLWFNRRTLWLSKHWLAIANAFFFTYVGLPILAPILMAAGFTRSANTIYFAYNMVCHQLPTRAYFIGGEQVAMCQRCVAMYVTFFGAGLMFNFIRFRPLAPHWFLLFALPMALDGGTAFISELSQVLPMTVFWVGGLTIMALMWGLLYHQKMLTWQVYVVFACGLLALLYLQLAGPRLSNWYLRTITGSIFAFGAVWFAYPTLEEGFKETWEQTRLKLSMAQASIQTEEPSQREGS